MKGNTQDLILVSEKGISIISDLLEDLKKKIASECCCVKDVSDLFLKISAEATKAHVVICYVK